MQSSDVESISQQDRANIKTWDRTFKAGLTHIGSLVSFCDRATRAILSHALIGEFRKKFFPHACPCGHNRLETRAHILTYPHGLDYNNAGVPFAPQKIQKLWESYHSACEPLLASCHLTRVSWLFLRWIFHQLQRHDARYPTSWQSALIHRALPRLQAVERIFDHRFTFIKEYKLWSWYRPTASFRRKISTFLSWISFSLLVDLTSIPLSPHRTAESRAEIVHPIQHSQNTLCSSIWKWSKDQDQMWIEGYCDAITDNWPDNTDTT